MYIKQLGATLLLLFPLMVLAQEQNGYNNRVKDSLYIETVQDDFPPKVLHAEPLYIDLIRDLGARKGEKEWNLGLGITDNLTFDTYEALVEYEWAPINRLGLEVEVPFLIYAPSKGLPIDSFSTPSSTMESLKLAGQWSFYVNEPAATSMAIGYINEFVFSDFENFGNPLIEANIFNPFFVIAKRWGNNFHTLIYTGPRLDFQYATEIWHNSYDINTNIHYMVPGTKNFIGVEFNKEIYQNDFDMTMRPQMRLELTHNILMGIVVGIPVARENERFSAFLRIIWEP